MKITIESAHHLNQFFQAATRYGHCLILTLQDGTVVHWKPGEPKPTGAVAAATFDTERSKSPVAAKNPKPIPTAAKPPKTQPRTARAPTTASKEPK